MKKITLLLILASLFVLVSCKGKTSSDNGLTEETKIQQLVKNGSATIVDVRTAEEFAEGHIENSVNVPLNEIDDSLTMLRQYEDIVVVCRSGKRSTQAMETLKANGFDNVYNGKGWETLNESLK